MNSGIYSITNIKNGKRHIGLTDNFKRRKRQHFRNLKKGIHGNEHLQSAFNKYGKDNFKFEIIKKCPIDKLVEEEQYFIKFYDSTNRKKGYNILESANENPVNKKEVRDKISKSQTGKKHTAEWKEKCSYWNTGKRNAMYGKPGTWRGKKFSETHKKRISESLYKNFVPNGDVLYKEWQDGATTRELAKKYNCSRRTIGRRIKSCGHEFKSKNATKFYRVYKKKDNNCTQGFRWIYRYKNENDKQCDISSVDLEKLKKKVLSKGLKWEEKSEE